MLNSFHWLNPPHNWDANPNRLLVEALPKTDFWRKTHYGFIRDSGHFYHQAMSGSFVAKVRVSGEYLSQYDQGGLMLRASVSHWMKCGIEFVDGVQQASVVVTNDFSDWSVTSLKQNPAAVWFQARRSGCDIEVFYSLDGQEFTHLRTACLQSADSIDLGLMCAAPQGPGFRIVFSDFSVEPLS